MLLAASAVQAESAAIPVCLKYGPRFACRNDAAVAASDAGHFLAWGGRETRGCEQCSRLVVGATSGGLYDSTGRQLETLPQVDGPGPRFGAQAVWTGAAFFVWGGESRQTERWSGDHHDVVSKVDATFNAFYVPGARHWVRMSLVEAPPAGSVLVPTADGVKACWSEGCKDFDMATNDWGPLALPSDG